MTSKKLSSSWLALAISIVFTASLGAQSAGTGALTGTVIDPSGAVVPGVSVVLVSLETNQTRTATTGGDGSYKFSLLPPAITVCALAPRDSRHPRPPRWRST